MDVLFFLKRRTDFIRRFYQTAGQSYRETIRKIEAGEAPFDNPPYSEDGEPPYMEEWQEADTSVQMIGRACLSMLSASLHLYFKTWESELGIEWQPGERKKAFKNGFLHGYRTYFGEVLKIDWDECPANLDILEQVTLARNRDQHPDHITMLYVTHAPADRTKFRQLFFVGDFEKRMLADAELADDPLIVPAVHVSRETLFAATEQVDV